MDQSKQAASTSQTAQTAQTAQTTQGAQQKEKTYTTYEKDVTKETTQAPQSQFGPPGPAPAIGGDGSQATQALHSTQPGQVNMETDTTNPSAGTATDKRLEANSTSDYIVAALHTAGILWATPGLRSGWTSFLPLVPAAMSLIDDGANKQGAKRAVIPALIGVGSLVVNSRSR